MDIVYIAAFIALVVALIERNHRRQALPRAPWGGLADRDLERVRHDLVTVDRFESEGPDRPDAAAAPEQGPRRHRRPVAEPSQAVCRAAASS